MNRKKIKTCLALIGTLSLILAVGAADGVSPSKRVEIDLDVGQALSDVSSILFSSSQVSQGSQIETLYADDQRTTIAVAADKDSASAPVYALAVAKGTDGQIVYSNVKQASSTTDTNSLYALSTCAEEAVDLKMQSQISLITNLVQVRAKRRSNFESSLEEKLSGELLEKLRRYEAGFGLELPTELSPKLTPAELVDRLDRILHTLRKISPS